MDSELREVNTSGPTLGTSSKNILQTASDDEQLDNAGDAGDDTPKGMLLVAGSAVCFSCMSLVVQCIARTGVPSCQIVFLNAIIRCVVAVPQLCKLTTWPFTSARVTRLILLRACGGFGGICCAFYAFSVLPLGDATVILFTAPVWTSLLAALVLGEKLKLADIASLLLCLGGVVLVARPSGDALAADAPRLIACGFALVGAMSAAVAYCCVRKLGRGTPPVVLVSVFSVMTVILAPVLMVAVGQEWHHIAETRVWGYVVAMGLCGYAGQILLNKGLQMGVAAKTTLARNLDIVLTFVLQVAVLGDPLDIWSVAGALLITGCTLLSFWKVYVDEHKNQAQQVKKEDATDDSQAYGECSLQDLQDDLQHSAVGANEVETLVAIVQVSDEESNQL